MTYIVDGDFLINVAKGNVSGHEIVNKFGANAVTATQTAWKVVSRTQGYQTPTSATALELVSTDNTNDIPAGTGARLVRVYGLKTPASTIEETEDVILNGTTAVALANSWWRVYRMKVISSGAYAALGTPSHNSTITLQVSGAGAAWSVIDSLGSFGLGQTETAAFTIPVGQAAYLLGYHIEVSGTNKDIDVALFVRDNADDVTTPYAGAMQTKAIHRNIVAGGSIEQNSNAPQLITTGPADIGFLSKASGATNYEVNVKFQLLCVS